MRHFRLCLLAMTSLFVAGCDQSESYQVGASQAYGKVLAAAYASGISPLPTGLAANGVQVRFNSIPTDRTAYWSFVKDGKELGRVNVAVTGDDASSEVSFNYADGDGASSSDAVARQVKQHMPVLVTEAVDASIESRPVNKDLVLTADNLTALALMGNVMNDASSAMDRAMKEQEERSRLRDAEISVSTAQHTSTQPMMDLDGN